MSGSRGKIILLSILLLSVTIYSYFFHNRDTDNIRYKTRTVDQGDILRTISANGTLTPLELIEVGTQISGQVLKLYADFNDEVTTGQVLAELDQALLLAQLRQSEANLKSAQTALSVAINRANRSRDLVNKGFISEEAMDDVIQALDAARAQVAVSKAQIARDQTNLDYCIIRSPISGVIVARDVNVGQTVAASFQTPTLFQIARDLKQMEINISVAEADIGQVHVEQSILFTVDAFQDREFSAVVKQIRLNPTIQENVVTYNVVATVINEDGSLLPGMTANVRFIVSERLDVLKIPNAALRYKPVQADDATTTQPKPGEQQVYRLENGQSMPISIQTGITDGSFTEVLADTLKAGDALIIEASSGKEKDKAQRSNFRFRMF